MKVDTTDRIEKKNAIDKIGTRAKIVELIRFICNFFREIVIRSLFTIFGAAFENTIFIVKLQYEKFLFTIFGAKFENLNLNFSIFQYSGVFFAFLAGIFLKFQNSLN